MTSWSILNFVVTQTWVRGAYYYSLEFVFLYAASKEQSTQYLLKSALLNDTDSDTIAFTRRLKEHVALDIELVFEKRLKPFVMKCMVRYIR